MDFPYKPPAIRGAPDGAVMAFSSRYSRDIALAAVHGMGGADGLMDWAKDNASNLADFWTKIFPKTITKDIVVEDRRNVVDLLLELDAESGAYTVPAGQAPIEAEFAPITVGAVDAEPENDDD